MEETIKMCKKNVDNTLIIKNIPKNLYGLYLNIGWVEYEEKKTKSTPKYSKNEEE